MNTEPGELFQYNDYYDVVTSKDWYRRLVGRVVYPIMAWVWAGETKVVARERWDDLG